MDVCYYMVNWQVSIGSGNDLMLNKWQASAWSNDDAFPRHMYALPDFNYR